MSKIDDSTAALKKDLDAVKADLATVSTGVQGLQAAAATNAQAIADLQAQLANAGLTDAQQSALADAQTEADALKVSADQLAADFPAPAA